MRAGLQLSPQNGALFFTMTSLFLIVEETGLLLVLKMMNEHRLPTFKIYLIMNVLSCVYCQAIDETKP